MGNSTIGTVQFIHVPSALFPWYNNKNDTKIKSTINILAKMLFAPLPDGSNKKPF